MKKYMLYDQNTLFVIDENEGTSKKIDVSGIVAEIDSVKSQIADLKLVKQDDKKLLKWAKNNFDFVSDLSRLQARLDELQLLKAEKDKL